MEEWVKKKKSPDCFSANPDDCYIMCWEQTPAEYKTVTRKAVQTPAQVKEVVVPAEYKTIKRQVIKTPASVTEIEVPAKYKTVTREVLVSPAREETVEVPGEYHTEPYWIVADLGGYTEWTEILCQEKTTVSVVQQLQQALKNRGYEVGPIDGVMGNKTRQALNKFQTDNNLPLGSLNIETLSLLAISY